MADPTEAAEASGKPVLKPNHPLVVLNIVSISGSLFYCNLCPAGSKAQKSSGSSSNIYSHIAMKHREASALLTRIKGANQFSFVSGRRVVGCDTRQQSIVASLANASASSATTATALLLARTGLAPRLVLDKPFQHFVKSLNAAASLPARKTLKRKLDDLYVDVRARVARRLDNALCFSVSCDGWSDPSRHALQGVVAHGVNRQMNLFTSVVDLAESGHGHKELAEILVALKARSDAGHDDDKNDGDASRRRMLAVVTDSTGANPRGVAEAFRDELSRTDDDDLFWWPCLCHLVNIVEVWSCRRMLAGDNAGSRANFTARQLARASATSGEIGADADKNMPVCRMTTEELDDAAAALTNDELSLGVLIKRCKLIARGIRMSDVRSALYRKHRDKMVPRPKTKIKTASPTRFSSQLVSFRSVVENERVLRDMVHDPSGVWPKSLVFGAEEVQMMQLFCDVLSKLEQLQALFSVDPASTGPVWADVVPSVASVLDFYLNLSQSQYSRTIERRFAGLVHEELQHYVGSIMFSARNSPPTMYECAALLDVRSTAWLLGKNYHTLHQYETKLRELEMALFDAPKDDRSAPAAAAAVPAIEEQEATTVLEIARRARAMAADAATSSGGGSAPGSGRRSRHGGRVRTQVQRELALYITEASSHAGLDGLAALRKWREWRERWPRLARLATFFACIPPGSIAVERLFSFTGRHIDLRRQHMSPEVQQRDAVLRGNPMLVDEAMGVWRAPASQKNK